MKPTLQTKGRPSKREGAFQIQDIESEKNSSMRPVGVEPQKIGVLFAPIKRRQKVHLELQQPTAGAAWSGGPVEFSGELVLSGSPSERLVLRIGDQDLILEVTPTVDPLRVRFSTQAALSTDGLAQLLVKTPAAELVLASVVLYPSDIDELISSVWRSLATPDFEDHFNRLRRSIHNDWTKLRFAEISEIISLWRTDKYVASEFRPESLAATAQMVAGPNLRKYNRLCLSAGRAYVIGPYSGALLPSRASFVTERMGREVAYLFIDDGHPFFSIQTLWPHGSLYFPEINKCVVLNPNNQKISENLLKEVQLTFLNMMAISPDFIDHPTTGAAVVCLEAAPYHFLWDHLHGLYQAAKDSPETFSYIALTDGVYIDPKALFGKRIAIHHRPSRRQLNRLMLKKGFSILGIAERLDQAADPAGYAEYSGALARSNPAVDPEFSSTLEAIEAVDRLVWFGISGLGQKRVWLNQVECIASLIAEAEAIAEAAGRTVGFVVDGWTSSLFRNGMPCPESLADEDVRDAIVKRSGTKRPVWSLIGRTGHEKLRVASSVTLAVTNAGTGAAFVSKLARRPTLLRDNIAMLDGNSSTWDTTTAIPVERDLIIEAPHGEGERFDYIDFSVDSAGLTKQFSALLQAEMARAGSGSNR